MQAARPEVWITGLGAVTPLGVGVPAFTRWLRGGRSGTRLISFHNEHMKSTVAAECRDFVPESVMSPADLARLPRVAPMALAAAREAAAMARLPVGEALPLDAARRVGLILGTGGGGIQFTLDQAEKVHAGGRASLWTITNATHGNLAGELSINLGLHGPSLCVSTGCASSSDAAGLALTLLRAGAFGQDVPETWVVVGADSHVCWGVLYPMELLRVISTRDCAGDPTQAAKASRPFDATRDGFVLGEGAWAAVVELESAARRREAPPIADFLGYGATCDAYHRVRPAPDMEESARAMRLAIADAGLRERDVEVVHYHGTGTQLNDALETAAVKMVFGDHAPRLRGHSVKSMIGHPQGAGGLAALVSTLAGLAGLDGGEPFIHPTINLEHPDPACDLDYTPHSAAPTDARTTLINCLAFGAKNSALVVRAART